MDKMKKLQKKLYYFDAAKQPAGRLASQVTKILIGKHQLNYLPYCQSNDIVIIKNINQLKFTGKKIIQKKYYRTSGYLGGLKVEKLQDLLKNNPIKVFRQIVYLMLPKNKLRKLRIKKLIIK